MEGFQREKRPFLCLRRLVFEALEKVSCRGQEWLRETNENSSKLEVVVLRP